MPLYDFTCEECGHAFEVLASFSELDGQPACPACGGHARRRFGTIQLGGKRTSIKPENFVRPHGPVTGRGGAGRS